MTFGDRSQDQVATGKDLLHCVWATANYGSYSYPFRSKPKLRPAFCRGERGERRMANGATGGSCRLNVSPFVAI